MVHAATTTVVPASAELFGPDGPSMMHGTVGTTNGAVLADLAERIRAGTLDRSSYRTQAHM